VQESLERAAQAVRDASFLVVAAGAGMGVDSGLPDFRGNEGFWRAYPPFAKLGLEFAEVANPHWFARDPALAWGFYGHRFNLYRNTEPHAGFAILKRWGATQVYTSNVDGHFQRAGFDAVCEVHGSILHAQCSIPCSREIWEFVDEIHVDEAFRAVGTLPFCRNCGASARPNILMFGDSAWIESRSGQQERALFTWLDSVDCTRAVVVEMGAGKAIPTVRRFSQHVQMRGAKLVRVSPRESDGPNGTISLELGAREALERIDALIEKRSPQ
jgi:NAD-dependent SIR2 family protein deacetylase